MHRLIAFSCLAGALLLGTPLDADAQEPASDFLAVGEMAPDFELVGATRFGVLSEPIHLSDYRGETVVLAFFFKARTRG